MSDWPAVAASPKPIGNLDIFGHSGIADGAGVTQPDYGPAHKIDQFLQPAIYRSCAIGSAIHCWDNAGNGSNGDGGWSTVATEFDRQEMILGYGQSTVTQTQAANVASYTTAQVAGFSALQWVILGAGSTTEIIQISASYVSTTGAGTLTFATNTAQAHTSGDPVYHAARNFGGFLSKSMMVIADTGGNDVNQLGPGSPASPLSNTWQIGTFGTTPGASRGLTPFMHAYRFSISQMRCAVIYKDTHVNVVYGANWNSLALSSVASNPAIKAFGGATGNYHYTTVAGSTLTFSTPPDFLGGTIYIFNFSYLDGGGAIWDYSVAGATTVALTSHSAGTVWDDRNINAAKFNDAVNIPTGRTTGSVKKITGLNAGVNTITLKATTVGATTGAGYGIFLGWGIEAPTPPLVTCVGMYRLNGARTGYGYGLWSTIYTRRMNFAAQTASVTGGQGTGAGSVTLGTAVIVGTTGTGATAVYPGDTITLDKGNSNEETRRIVAVASTTTLSVDANFVNTHTTAPCQIGLQDADMVGGGYVNTADTQGATSVPGLNGAIKSVVNEFDQFVQYVDFDSLVNPPGSGTQPPADGLNSNLSLDGVHLSDAGGGATAYGLVQKVNSFARPTLKDLSTYVLPNKRTPLPVYGELYPAVAFAPGAGALAQLYTASGWTNFYPMSSGAVLRTSLYKDARTRMVTLQGAITNWLGIRDDQLPSAAITLPSGYRPRALTKIDAWSSYGPAVMEAHSDGNVYVVAGFAVTNGSTTVNGASQVEPTGTLTVTSTAGFGTTGVLTIAGVTGTVAYTGITGTTFTGCTGGSGTATNGGAVTGSPPTVGGPYLEFYGEWYPES